MKFHKFILLFFFLSFCLTSIFPPVNLTHAGINEWTAIGPEGGEVYDLAIYPKDPNILFAVFEDGLFKSTDGGINWYLVETDLVGIATITIDPSNPNVLYARVYGGDPCADYGLQLQFIICSVRPDLYGALNLFKSEDGGINWYRLSGISAVRFLAINPIDPNVIYAATYHGIFKSVDGGASWNQTTFGDFPASTVAIDPSNPDIIYAATWSEYGSNNSVFKSTDGGSSWSQTGLINTSVSALAINPVNPDIIYAVNATSVLKTVDGGLTWNTTGNGQMTLIGTIAIDPLNPNVIYVGTGDYYYRYGNGAFKSTDGGVSWTSVNTGLPSRASVRDLVINPMNPDIIYAGTHKGIFKSIDGGNNWNPTYADLPMANNPVTTVSINPLDPNAIYATTANSFIYKSSNGGNNWIPVSPGLPGPYVCCFDNLAINPTNPNIIYAGGGGVYKSNDGGTNWTLAQIKPPDLPFPLWPYDIRRITIDPLNPDTIYAVTEKGVFKSVDGGTNWNPINNGLIDVDVHSLAIDPKNPNIIYAGTYDKGIFKSRDSGAIWNCSGLRNFYVISSLVIDPLNSNRLYAGSIDGLFKSNDGGRNWNHMNIGLKATNIRSLAIDPFNPNIIYAGTEKGVFKSTNRGLNWFAVNNGLPDLSVRALTIDRVDPTAVYAGTDSGLFKIQFIEVKLTSPGGGETLTAGSTQTILWNYTGNLGAYVKIELLKGGVVNRVIKFLAPKGTGGNGSCNWTIPANQTPGTDYRIRVTSTTYGGCTYTSDSDFTIATPTITVASPNSGETWSARSIQTIRWTYTGNPGSYVKIELLKGGFVNRTIASFASKGSGGNGSYNWRIPANQASGTDYSIRVTSTSNNSYSDTGESSFTIGR